MSVNQTKLAHQLIIVINAFLGPLNERKEKAHAYYLISRAVSEAIKRWLNGRS